MKKRTKNIIIVGGSLAVLYYLISAYAFGGKSGVKNILGIKQEPPKKVVKPKSPLKKPRTQPMVVYGGGGGKGGGHFTQTFPDTVPMPTQQGHTTEGNNQSGGKVPIQVVIPYVDNSNNVIL
jgi:hypothetical protein